MQTPSGQVGPVDPAPRPTRRSFTAEYKARVVAEYEAAPHGEKSAVLRREGLFHSHVKEWTRARDAGVTPANTNGRRTRRRRAGCREPNARPNGYGPRTPG